MLDSVIRDWLEPSPLHPLRAMSGNMWALHPSSTIRNHANNNNSNNEIRIHGK
jgi:hypothetical protein